tara:strand:- start:1710 stop:2189 length:480 start_codon:yes stop_codon:yes gene_type:complete
MGQYHYTCNLDKREYLNPFELGTALKLKEQMWNTPGVPVALYILTAASNGRGGGDVNDELNYDDIHNPNGVVGRWAGDRIATIGDYFDQPNEYNRTDASRLKVNEKEFVDLWNREYEDISGIVRECMNHCGLGGKIAFESYETGGTQGHYVFKESPLHY